MAKNWNEYKHVTTMTGTVLFSHIKQTEEILGKDTGKYTLCVAFDDEDIEKLNKVAMDEFIKATEDDFAGKKFKKGIDPVVGEKEYNGQRYLRFSTGASYQTKTGRNFVVTVPIFDAVKNTITNNVGELGHGSKVRINYTIIPYYMTANNFGVTLRLGAIQLLDYKPLGEQSADDFGFGTVEGGFDGTSIKDNDLPWTPADGEADEEDAGGDF